MKKIVTIALSFVMVIGLFSIISFAANDVVVEAVYNKAKAGEAVTLTVKLKSTVTPIGGMDLIVKYDTNKLKVTSTEDEISGSTEMPHATMSAATLAYKGNSDQIKVLTADINKMQQSPCTIAVIKFEATKDISDGAFSFEQTTFTKESADKIEDVNATVSATQQKEPEKAAADVAKLNTAIKAAEKLKEEDYTEASYKPFAEALTAAKALQNETSIDKQADIDKAATTLVNATAALVKHATFEDLTKLIATAKEKDSSKYTEKSYLALKTAITEAEKITSAASVKDIETEYTALTNAIKALATPAQDKLLSAIDAANKIDTSKFSESDLKALSDALAKASEVLGNENASDADIAAVLASLDTAMNPDTSDINVMIFAVLAILALAAAGFVVIKKRKTE